MTLPSYSLHAVITCVQSVVAGVLASFQRVHTTHDTAVPALFILDGDALTQKPIAVKVREWGSICVA